MTEQDRKRASQAGMHMDSTEKQKFRKGTRGKNLKKWNNGKKEQQKEGGNMKEIKEEMNRIAILGNIKMTS